MRPRQSSLGIIARCSVTSNLAPRVPCFNEAEAIKPRNRPLTGNRIPVGDFATSFNEAEAIKPRNPPCYPATPLANTARFNEAEAIKPRNPPRPPQFFPKRIPLQ